MAKVNPYLKFNGNCEEAFNFYKSVFGGEFPYVGRFSEMPAEFPILEADKNRIMHISLPISSETTLMGEDSTSEFGGAYTAGNNFTVAINAENEEEATKLFKGLSAGGKVTMPLEKAFWGALFGMLTDKFGISWVVSCELKKD